MTKSSGSRQEAALLGVLLVLGVVVALSLLIAGAAKLISNTSSGRLVGETGQPSANTQTVSKAFTLGGSIARVYLANRTETDNLRLSATDLARSSCSKEYASKVEFDDCVRGFSTTLSGEVTTASNDRESLNSLRVHGFLISAGKTTADSVFEVLHHSDEISDAVSEPDPELPSSLVVTHKYLVDGKAFSLTLKRLVTDGPYVVSAIDRYSQPNSGR